MAVHRPVGKPSIENKANAFREAFRRRPSKFQKQALAAQNTTQRRK